MKTKYVKVPVSERLPEKSGFYFTSKNSGVTEVVWFMDGKFSYVKPSYTPEFWLEEKEDHSEEMLSMLERVVSFASLGEKVPDFLTHEIEQLINKVKDNGK
ncbi:hypothetical protein HZQ94_14840 [Elizabethkingia anophelis]|nr:hypothetical protein [Elizabethkingia anophelis]MCT3682057.1 hypothetical protein [Elizabethkingia anophelis]